MKPCKELTLKDIAVEPPCEVPEQVTFNPGRWHPSFPDKMTQDAKGLDPPHATSSSQDATATCCAEAPGTDSVTEPMICGAPAFSELSRAFLD